jgi:hypothetical protein
MAAKLEKLYCDSNDEIRDRIICGALEHIFEEKMLVSYFQSWQNDSDLKEAFMAALEWGEAHREES